MWRLKALIAILLTCSSIMGCSTLIPYLPANPGFDSSFNQSSLKNSWRAVRFKFKWQESKDGIDLSPDLLIAQAVIRPILLECADKLPLWRFHRRAVNDSSGHVFSFIFFSSDEVTNGIFQKIKESPLLVKTIENKVVQQVIFEDTSDRQEISTLSDPNWSEPMRNAWPVYAMGISALWLNLSSELVGDGPDYNRSSMAELIQYYNKVNHEVSEIWDKDGSHALLHHLNAVFGYEPLTLRKMNF